MPLLDPIVEAMKPSMSGARFLDTPVPENITPILELLRARAVAFALDGVPHWEITTNNGVEYARVAQEYLGDDEAEWTKLIGMLLDYAAAKSA
jgi:hypothetical protein